jgi:hypothetical protein
MDKNQKMLLGVAVVGVGAYLLWKSKQPKKAFMNAGGCPSGYTRTKNSNGVFVCDNGKGSRYRTNMSGKMGADGVKGLDVSGKLVNRKRMVGANGKRKGMLGANGVGNRKRMVGMINSSNVKEGPFGKKNLINSTNVQEGSFKKNLINSTKVQEGSFKTFTPENLGSDLLSVKNSNFFDQNILGSKFS